MPSQRAFDFCQRPVRAKKPERLFFAAMPDDASVFAVGECAERFLIANALEGVRLKPMIALQRLAESCDPVLFGAKLAGQAVPAAGLVFKFDTITTVNAERRILALTASDPALATLHQRLGAALQRNGLRTDDLAPFVPLAHGIARMAPEAVKPVKIRVTALALLRGEATGDFQVLRRWPLNRERARS